MNRFSGDVNTVDTQLPASFSGFSGTVLRVIATMVVMAIVFPELLAAILPLALVYLAVQHFYRPASRELKRLDSITKSPVYAHLSETLSGLSTISAYGLNSSFVKVSQARTDTNAVVYLKMNLINRWLGLRLDWVRPACLALPGWAEKAYLPYISCFRSLLAVPLFAVAWRLLCLSSASLVLTVCSLPLALHLDSLCRWVPSWSASPPWLPC